MKLVFIGPDNARIELDVPGGATLMRAAVANGVRGIVADCGGCISCGTCHVYVQKPFIDRLPAISVNEEAMLENTASERQWNSRLSCQIELTEELDGLTVNLPPLQR